jgi:uncharacterized membrane protein YkvA (DUF1232 family)
MKVMRTWKERARLLKGEVFALYLAYRDPRVPWHARLAIACVVGYALSPIDLIPDFIPVLGYLDDLVLLPLGVALALKLVPPDVLDECRARAQTAMTEDRRSNWIAGGLFIAVWLLLAALVTIFAIQAARD